METHEQMLQILDELTKEQTTMALEIANWKNLSYTQQLALQQYTPVDCSFIVGEGMNARTVGAHKAILACMSETFNSMFSGNYKESDASFDIPLPNVVDYGDFIVILEYIYYTKTNIEFLNLERLKHVAYLADYYMLDKLLNKCHIKIERAAKDVDCSFHDFLQIFEYEKKLGRVVITKKSFTYPSQVLLTNTSIYDLDPLYFYDLLKVLTPSLKESERFTLIENYAKIHGLKMDRFFINYIKSDDFEDVQSRTQNNSKSLKEMFELIDFKKMTSKEFKNGPAVSKVWTASPEEKLFILNNLQPEVVTVLKTIEPQGNCRHCRRQPY